MTGHLMPDRIDGTDVIDEWKVRRDMALEEQAREKEKTAEDTADK